MNIGVLDYKVGNVANVLRCLNFIDSKSNVALANANNLKSFDKLILPGVGSFQKAMSNLAETNSLESVLEFAKSGRYMLGICLGAQILFERGYEFGSHEGLGLLKGEVKGFKSLKAFEEGKIKVPHIGWNKNYKTSASPLLDGLEDEFYLYFDHGFYMECEKDALLARCEYGVTFASIVGKDNIFGIQPHPEKSHNSGMKILENFLALK
ncbi:imidazole glycerol phosphate synthase, glutamine amidotransferase subunit [Helicobacter sp. 13S00401-1]|uniref:imidazole glycerol phosphate synthase subunit HisH n=1 Tax=Helicobacter sp. 13S00401-1 TaxID=1905758 RepID=UPI000BA6C514|nr:imidazole glycerol phosphate synthase subunit HisH [Helicobacter sp. 13S00401-1]PAF50196.1 imidazole glycerol phosphate synthase, glutamine amidotransferase subunit [Helicobacter sp. 13S00401-1]